MSTEGKAWSRVSSAVTARRQWLCTPSSPFRGSFVAAGCFAAPGESCCRFEEGAAGETTLPYRQELLSCPLSAVKRPRFAASWFAGWVSLFQPQQGLVPSPLAGLRSCGRAGAAQHKAHGLAVACPAHGASSPAGAFEYWSVWGEDTVPGLPETSSQMETGRYLGTSRQAERLCPAHRIAPLWGPWRFIPCWQGHSQA